MRFIILSFFLLISFWSKAQVSYDHKYWLAFMENLTLDLNDHPQFSIVISSNEEASAKIRLPQKGFIENISLAAGEVREYIFPSSILYESGSEQTGNSGILIESTQKVTCVAYHYRIFFSEATKVPSLTELGKNYIVIAENGNNPNAIENSQFVILATEDQTQVEITPSVNTLGLLPAHEVQKIILDKGQTYQVQSTSDLSGSQIKSNKKIAVYSGAKRASLCLTEPGAFADNHIFDFNLPIESWGKEYFAAPFLHNGTAIVKLVAAKDNTIITVNGIEHILNRYESLRVPISQPTVFSSEESFVAGLFHTSQNCNQGSIGDPNFTTIYPTGSEINSANFLSSDTRYSYENYSLIITQTNSVNEVSLDGAPLTQPFTPFPDNSNYSYLRLKLAPGRHNLSSDSGFVAYNYGLAEYDAYTYSLGEISTPLQNTSCNLFVPNLVTANNDGKNDKFMLPKTNLTVKIYNRWGEKVFEARDYQNNWPKQKVTPGIFYYFIKDEDCQLKGWVKVVE